MSKLILNIKPDRKKIYYTYSCVQDPYNWFELPNQSEIVKIAIIRNKILIIKDIKDNLWCCYFKQKKPFCIKEIVFMDVIEFPKLD